METSDRMANGKFILIILTFLLIECSVNAERVSLTLPNSQTYYCEENVITCIGKGGSILWTAPPSIMDNAPDGFIFASMLDVPREIGDVQIVLTNVELGSPSTCTSELTMSKFAEITVTCQTDIPGSLESLPLIRSGAPLDVMSPNTLYFNGSVSITWSDNPGQFDLNHYIIHLFEDDSQTSTTTTDRREISFSVTSGTQVYARVITVSKCGHKSNGVVTNTVTIPAETGISEGAIIGITVSFVIIVLLLVAILILVLVKLKSSKMKEAPRVPSSVHQCL